MAPPPWVIIDRTVNFIDRGAAASGGAIGAGEGSSGAAAASRRWSLEPNPAAGMAAMIPYPVVEDPPEVTHLSMLLRTPVHLMDGVRSGTISSSDKGLVVLYTGMYRPGSGGYSRGGCYLVYKVWSGSLSVVPRVPEPASSSYIALPTIRGLGSSAAILRHSRFGEDAYVIAELATTFHPGLPAAELYLWWSPSSSTANPCGQWTRTSVRLPLPPELSGPTYSFNVDMAFAFAGSRVCWVDLVAGVLTCDLFAPQGPDFNFIPLPEGSCLRYPDDVRLGLKAKEFRSMGCVSGAIKFVALIGYTEGRPSSEVSLITWTLSSDFKEWKKSSEVLVGDLWESESFKEMKLPRVRPMCPLLSMDEDEIVYVFLNDIEYVDVRNDFRQITGRRIVLHGHYALRLDLLQNKVLFSKKSSTNNLAQLAPTLLVSDLSAYLHLYKDRQREEASAGGATAKRPKH